MIMVIKKAIVGLGNPGARYERTRHNVGFEVVDRIASRCGVGLRRSSGLQARVAECDGAVLVEPDTFMNLSGRAVRSVCRKYSIPREGVLIICDDMNLAPAKVRFRKSGSAGGHNGLKSIISDLGADVFPRIKIGVGHPGDPDLAADYVLSRLAPDEWAQFDAVFDIVAESCFQWLGGEDIAVVLNNKLQNMS